jgi:SnoaL-like domain
VSATTDHQKLTELIYTYALGIDTRDWPLYRSIFADEVTTDFTSYSGGRAATVSADAWLARVKPVFTGLAATQHTMTNPIVRVDGNRASCTMYMQAFHALEPATVVPTTDENSFTLGGYYTDTFILTDGRWLVNGVTLTVLWRRGNESIMATAAQRGTTLLTLAETHA